MFYHTLYYLSFKIYWSIKIFNMATNFVDSVTIFTLFSFGHLCFFSSSPSSFNIHSHRTPLWWKRCMHIFCRRIHICVREMHTNFFFLLLCSRFDITMIFYLNELTIELSQQQTKQNQTKHAHKHANEIPKLPRTTSTMTKKKEANIFKLIERKRDLINI